MNLLDLVKQATNSEGKQVSRKGGGEYAFPCPFCSASKDGFHVWPEQTIPWCICHTCGFQGGSILFMMKWQNIDGVEAKKRLAEMNLLELPVANYVPAPILAPSPSDIHIKMDIRHVEKWYRMGREAAYDYFREWGLTMEDIDRHWFGWGDYNGRGGITIPHFWTTRTSQILKGVKFRHPGEQHRFSCVDDSITRGVWYDWLVTLPDGTREGPILNHLFILEAEKDAALMNGLGYPAIAYFPEKSWNKYLWYVLKNVIQPVIIYDNDGGKGLNRANEVASYLKTRPTIVSTTDYNVKSPSDLARRDGREAVTYWMYELGY